MSLYRGTINRLLLLLYIYIFLLYILYIVKIQYEFMISDYLVKNISNNLPKTYQFKIKKT